MGFDVSLPTLCDDLRSYGTCQLGLWKDVIICNHRHTSDDLGHDLPELGRTLGGSIVTLRHDEQSDASRCGEVRYVTSRA